MATTVLRDAVQILDITESNVHEIITCEPITSSPLMCATDSSSSSVSVSTPDSGIQVGESRDEPVTKKPKKKHKNQPPDADLLPPCRVCGDKASGLHYGANTCEPCKGFFRRSIVKVEKKKEEYKCVKDGNCNLGTGKRTMCSYCRYKKCLEVGMSHGAIKIGRYTYEKKTRDIKEVKQLKQIVNSPDVNAITNVSEQEVNCLVDKLIKIQEEFVEDFRQIFQPNWFLDQQLSAYESYKMKQEIFGNLATLPSSVYEEFHEATGIDLDDRQRKRSIVAVRMDGAIRNMITFAKSLPGFSDLVLSDQLALIKASFLEYKFLGHYNQLNSELKVIAFVGNVCPSKGAHTSDLTAILDQKSFDKLFEYAARVQKCQLTAEEVTLARGIIITFSDRCKLEEPDKVDKIHWNLINSLRLLVAKKYSNPNERLWKIIDKFTLLRELSECGKKVNSIRAKWPVMQDHPLVLEMINT